MFNIKNFILKIVKAIKKFFLTLYKYFFKLKTFYRIVFVILILILFFVCIYFLFIHKPKDINKKIVEEYLKQDTKANEGLTPQQIVQRVQRGEALPADAPQDYKDDNAKFKTLSRIRNKLADYYDKNRYYPDTLDVLGENGTELVNSKIIYIPSKNKISDKVNNKYTITVTFSTEEAVLVGANVKYSNQNKYNIKNKTVIFTEMSGNFFNFTGSTIK